MVSFHVRTDLASLVEFCNQRDIVLVCPYTQSNCWAEHWDKSSPYATSFQRRIESPLSRTLRGIAICVSGMVPLLALLEIFGLCRNVPDELLSLGTLLVLVYLGWYGLLVASSPTFEGLSTFTKALFYAFGSIAASVSFMYFVMHFKMDRNSDLEISAIILLVMGGLSLMFPILFTRDGTIRKWLHRNLGVALAILFPILLWVANDSFEPYLIVGIVVLIYTSYGWLVQRRITEVDRLREADRDVCYKLYRSRAGQVLHHHI